MPTVLIVDDEPGVRYSLRQGLESPELRVQTAASVTEAVEAVRRETPDAVVLDVRLPDGSGLDALDQLLKIAPRLPVIVVTAFDAIDTAIRAMKGGAFEVLIKPLDLDQLSDVVNRAVELSRLRTVPAVFEGSADASSAADYIVGRSTAMQNVSKDVGRVAPQDVTVLIIGESGTGKELIARAIFQHSNRANRPFLALNCAAIPEPLLESEFFGHEKGAFTGADRKRIGKFEQADGGTIFLDEIGDMAPGLQSKVLRLLQDQRFERLGGDETIRTDVRLIAATNQDLAERVASGRFRADLFYRLNVFTIRLPPLRERKDDIPLLVDHFFQRFSGPLGKPVRAIAPEALQLLIAHDWPGNIRELQSVVKAAMLRAAGEHLTVDCLPMSLRPTATPCRPSVEEGGDLPDVARLVKGLLAEGEMDLYRKVVSSIDRVVLEHVLLHCHGNLGQASEWLGISRTTLRSKLRGLGMSVERVPVSDNEPDEGG